MKKLSYPLIIAIVLALVLPFYLNTSTNNREVGLATNMEMEKKIVESSRKLVDGRVFNDKNDRVVFNGYEFPENIEDYAFTENATPEDGVAVGNWLKESGFDFENKDDIGYINDNFAKLAIKAVETGQVRDFISPSTNLSDSGKPKAEPVWKQPNHTTIYNEALRVLTNDGKIATRNFFNNYSSLAQHTTEPDDDENMFYKILGMPYWVNFEYKGTHMYNTNSTPQNGYYKNTRNNGVDYLHSAKTRLEDHYSMALTAYKNGDVASAIKRLGYAIHYLQDIGNSAHSSGVDVDTAAWLLGGDYHALYEDYAENYLGNFVGLATSANNYYGDFDHYMGWNVINEFALTTGKSSYRNAVTNPNIYTTIVHPVLGIFSYLDISQQHIIYADMLTETVPLTIYYVAALLDQFYKDKTSWDNQQPTGRMDAAIKEGYAYYISSCLSYMYMQGSTTVGAQVTQQGYTGGTNQKFYARYNADGCELLFSPSNDINKCIAASQGKICTIKNFSGSDRSLRFRVTYLGSNQYRIAIADASIQFEPILAVDTNSGTQGYVPGRPIRDTSFLPNNMEHYWKITKV